MNTETHDGTRLRDLAGFIRSKNAGPFTLTIDIFFQSDEDCARVLRSDTVSAAVVAELYGVPAEDVRILHIAQAGALKISFPRPVPAGDVGDRDVAGGQQFAPLLDLAVPAR